MNFVITVLATDGSAVSGTLVMDWINENQGTLTMWGGRAVGVLVVLFVAWLTAGWLGRIVRSGLRKAKIDETLAQFFGKLVRWVVLVFAVLGCLGMFGVEVTAFAAVIAATGFAIGLAFQGTLSNFSAGVMLLIFRPFKIGDVVSVAGHTGKVSEIDLFVTILDTPDNRRLILPNGSVFGAAIENKSYHATRRVEVTVGTDYGADVDKTRAVLEKAAASMEGIASGTEPQVVLGGLGASSIDWSVRVWTTTSNFWSLKEALTRAVKMELDAAGIGIPFPQMDVHLDPPAGG